MKRYSLNWNYLGINKECLNWLAINKGVFFIKFKWFHYCSALWACITAFTIIGKGSLYIFSFNCFRHESKKIKEKVSFICPF